jgi:two-component system cell cycle sensor histidine kinase/response regulator CckA
MQNIRAVAIRGTEIVRQLMIYAGQQKDTFALVDISRLIEEAIKLLELVVSKHAALRSRFGTEVPAVRANTAMLRQILIALISHASEAIDEADGMIDLTTARDAVKPNSSAASGGLSAGDYLQLEASDTGCRMTPDTQAKIFDPFFTTKTQGHGLGLAEIHGIVTGLGGAIAGCSQPKHGATIHVLLPDAGKSSPTSLDCTAAAGENR